MRIDARIEPLVREVLDASVKKDLNRLEAGLAAVGDGPDAALAIQLALAICVYVLLELHDGNRPTGAQIDSLAQEIARDEGWAQVRGGDVVALLTNLFSGPQLDKGMPVEEAITLPFIVAANLLASSSEPADGNRWFDYLDEIEEKLEATNA
ncbi:hypothetical protein GCM10023322_52080 [Rugosimonospora acidiphila]|uniref:Uncharacterized protein n=1 Tax=Rugosimonospora acidiphila TaxID=556531 RepID=A0ABP9S992_9ACTN